MELEARKIEDAWHEALEQLGLRPGADKNIQKELIPSGGDWQCVAAEGAVTRSITWNGNEVALVNPRGTFGDRSEGNIAMGMRATPVMDKAIRVIFVLAKDAGNLDLIARIAQAAIAYVEQPAPPIRDPEPEPDEEEVEYDE